MSTTIRQILKRAPDTEELRIITSDELLALPAEAYKQEFGGHNTDIPPFRLRYVCSLAPRLGSQTSPSRRKAAV